MNIEANHEQDLFRLCGLVVDGELEDSDRERLSELLATDVNSRELYRCYMDVHARLLLQFEPVPEFDESEEKPVRLNSERRASGGRSANWQFAASAAIVLFTILTLVQSAGNLIAARGSTPVHVAGSIDSEFKALANEFFKLRAYEKRVRYLGPSED